MQIEINNQRNLLGQDAQMNAIARIETSFSKFRNRIKSVVLTAKDLNGPRGGVDKQCLILVSLNGIGDVVATVEHASLSQAIGSAIKSAERSITRRVRKAARKQTRRRFAMSQN
jgi:putative sigma-54 modulation protein